MSCSLMATKDKVTSAMKYFYSISQMMLLHIPSEHRSIDLASVGNVYRKFVLIDRLVTDSHT